MRKRFHVPIILSCMVLFAACIGNMSKHKKLITIQDMLGRSVEVPKNADKVIGVKAGALRMLSYLDAADRIAGVEEIERQNKNPYNFANPHYAKLPVIGPKHGGDAELIAFTGADIIFMTYATVGEADKLQSQTGIPVVALNYGDLGSNKETFYSALRLMSKLIDRTARADSLINFIESTIEDLKKRTEGVTNIPVVYAAGISFKGTHGISSTAPEYVPFEYINVKNIASGFHSPSNNVFVDKEQIIEWNPEYIFVDYAGWSLVNDELENKAFSQTLDAVKSKKIYLLYPYNWYTTNFATVFLNSYYTGSVLFPDKFSDIDFEEKANSIYEVFLQKPIYHEMAKQFGELKQVEENESGNHTR